MRLVHPSLITILPKVETRNLIRDLALVADEIQYMQDYDYREEMHETTKKVLSFPLSHFVSYYRLVIARAIELNVDYSLDIDSVALMNDFPQILTADIFGGWMDTWYFIDDIKFLEDSYPNDPILGAEDLWYEIC